MLKGLERYFEERKMAGLYRKQEKMLDLIQLSVQTEDRQKSDKLLKQAGRLMDRISAGLSTDDQARALGLKLSQFGEENPEARGIAERLINMTEERLIKRFLSRHGTQL